MQQLVLVSMFVIASCSLVLGQTNASCADFNKLIKSTYNFRPALLQNDAERSRKSAAINKVWEAVKAKRAELLPCLISALEDPKTDPWFRFDGSNLLVSLDPSDGAKRIQVNNYAVTNLDDVDLRMWVTGLLRRGLENYDVSAAGERWLSYAKGRYFLPEHGFEVGVFTGALFIFGSMDETFATPALIKIGGEPNHPGREAALGLLIDQQTPESRRFLKQVDLSTVSQYLRKLIRDELERPKLLMPRAQPKTTRQEFIEAFQALLNGNPAVFFGLAEEVSDSERDIVATLTTDDLPLVRKVRRQMIAGGNQYSLEFYDSFTKIIRTIVVRPSR